MNVYIKNTALQLARQGVEVDIFTRATRPLQGEVVHVAPGLRVINCVAGPYEGLPKEELPTQLAAFTGSVLAFQRKSQQRATEDAEGTQNECADVGLSLIHI